jgi:hypothetical protein
MKAGSQAEALAFLASTRYLTDVLPPHRNALISGSAKKIAAPISSEKEKNSAFIPRLRNPR